MAEEVAERENVINIPPLKKGKRVLLFLADFFIVFVVTLLIFHVGVYPLGRLITNYDGQQASLREYQKSRDSVLYGNFLLFEKDGGSREYDQFDANLENTSILFIRDLVLEDGSGEDVFENYYLDIRDDLSAYISVFKDVDAKTNFLEIASDSISLKQQYKEEFFPYFNPGDTMSSKGKTDFASFQDRVFAQAYQRMLADIREKDLSFAGVSYNANQAEIEKILQNSTNLVVFGAITAYVVVWIIFMLLFPTIGKRHRTLAMFALRIERLRHREMKEISLPVVYLNSLYFLIGGMLAIQFVPWGTVPFNEMFSLPVLFPLALISLAYILGSLAFMLFDSYNRTLGDFFTRTIMLDEQDLDGVVSITGGSGWLKKE